jgi:hypothetical protein
MLVSQEHKGIMSMALEFMVIASLIREISGKCTSVTDSIHCSKKAILCSQSNDVDHIREEVVNSHDGQIKMDLDPILYRPSVIIHFPLKFQVISNIFLLDWRFSQ